MLNQILFVGLGGCLGAIARFVVIYLIGSILAPFPLGTLVVNICGCFMIGFFFVAFSDHPQFGAMSLFFVTGFLGALTTFSTFSSETIQIFHSDKTLVAGLNIILSIVCCFLAVLFGQWLGSIIKV